MSILEFMYKLDTNLNSSLNSFKKLVTNMDKTVNMTELHLVIQKNNQNLYNYLEQLKALELLYFTEQPSEKNKFLYSFNIDQTLYNKNFTNSFKTDAQLNINLHKLKSTQPMPPGLPEIIPNTKFKPNVNINVLDTKDISPNNLNIPIIKNLKDIPPMFHWFEGDNSYKKGIYVCMSKGFYSKVPFPNMVSTLDQNFKINSIPCKYETKLSCQLHKKKISEIFNSEVRECYYVHQKEKFVKIGSSYRCNVESFGNHNSLNNDINYVTIIDIKRILMHSLSDSLLSVLWYQNKFKNGDLYLHNLEIY